MPKLIGMLPPEAQAIIKAAAQQGPPGSIQRQAAIDKANQRVRDLYPAFFKDTGTMKFNLNDVRIAFPSLFEPSAIDGGEPAFAVKAIVPPTHAQVAALDDAMRAVAREKWGAKGDQVFENLVKVGKKPEVGFVKEPYKNRDGDPYDGFDGMYYVTARSQTRPLIVDRNKAQLVQPDGKPYAGCYCNLILELWAQDNKYGRAIRINLKGVQFLRDGDAFSGGAPASVDDFADLSDGADADAGDLA
jgi:hypothetical protein